MLPFLHETYPNHKEQIPTHYQMYPQKYVHDTHNVHVPFGKKMSFNKKNDQRIYSLSKLRLPFIFKVSHFQNSNIFFQRARVKTTGHDIIILGNLIKCVTSNGNKTIFRQISTKNHVLYIYFPISYLLY